MCVYNHKVDKSIIPTCNILGVNIAAIDMDWLLKFIEKYIKELSGDYICVANVHTTVMAFEDKKYRKVQNGGIMSIPDGGPLSFIGRKRGYKEMKRTTGPDLMNKIFKVSAERGYRHYFYGSTNETLDKMIKQIEKNYCGIKIAGVYSPPFGNPTEGESEAILNQINHSNSDFIWVGLGAPKQEKWMLANQGRVKGLMIGVGAGFDYCAANIKRAPKWIQNINMEWFYRFIQEPKKLFKRYLYTNTKFIWYAYLCKK